MEQTTKYFILKDSGLHYIPDMPKDFESEFQSTRQKYIDSSILVANQMDTELMLTVGRFMLHENVIYGLLCEVEIQSNCECPESSTIGCQKMDSVEKCKTTYLAFVKVKEETKEGYEIKSEFKCPECGKITHAPQFCKNPTTGRCDLKDAVTKEEEQRNLLFKFQRFLERTTGDALDPKSEDWMIEQNIKQFLKEFNLNN